MKTLFLLMVLWYITNSNVGLTFLHSANIPLPLGTFRTKAGMNLHSPEVI